MGLTGLQHSLMHNLHRGTPPPAGLMAAEGRGWAIYRAGYLANHTEALRDVYPVTGRLVGGDCFTNLARAYLREHPSVHADLHRYGAGFPSFLRGIPALSGLPYLPEMARLEWLAHEAFHAAAAPTLKPAKLASVPGEHLPGLRLRPHPSVRLMRSDYPVQRIWQVNQPNWAGEATVELDEGEVALAVYRDGLEITLLPLDPGAYVMAESFQAGHDLGQAFERLQTAAPEADPAQALHTLLHHGLLVDFDH